MEINTHRVPAKCPIKGCGAVLDAASGGAEAPKPGDVTVCMYCGEWLVFTEVMDLRPITEEEIVTLDNGLFEKLRAGTRAAAMLRANPERYRPRGKR